jgi:hypothetical protein
MLSAMKNADLKQAARLAAEAKRQAHQALSALEALPQPDYDQLEEFLQDTIRGYQLVSEGFDSYSRGIPQLDLKRLRKGDEQTKSGLREINQATQDFFQFLRSQ